MILEDSHAQRLADKFTNSIVSRRELQIGNEQQQMRDTNSGFVPLEEFNAFSNFHEIQVQYKNEVIQNLEQQNSELLEQLEMF